MKLLLYCLLVILWPTRQTYAQNSTTKIRPLTIGDTLPADLIVENVTNYPTSKIQLSKLKGKLMILDFWSKYCAPCILTLNKLDSFQKASSGKIQVITISDFKDKNELHKALQRFKKIESLSLPVVLGNEQLINYFPYSLVSHLIWIDSTGVVRGITDGEYITASNIQDMLSGKENNWPVKKDVIEFDYKKPLLEYTQSEQSRPTSIYYSALTSYMDGIAPPSGTTIDETRNLSFTAFYNYDLLSLCQISIDYRTGARKEQFILEVKDTNRYLKAKGLQRANWRKANTYCYYISLPSHISSEQIGTIIKDDLTRWLRILGIEVNKVKEYRNGIPTEVYIIKEKAISDSLINTTSKN